MQGRKGKVCERLMKAVCLKDSFLAPRQKTCREVTIPSALRKCEETGRLKAYLLQWKPGNPDAPHVYWDSDVAKVLEGMAEMLMIHPDPAMAEELDRLVDLVIGAQQPDGFLNVHFTVVEPGNRWSYCGGRHELYCAGHLIEAAVAHFKCTGSVKFLNAVCRYADYIATVFGNGPGRMRGYPGHAEIELALMKLYQVTGNRTYLDLAKYFIDERGQDPEYYEALMPKTSAPLHNIQAHKPVRRQEKAEGHAVRAVYLYCGIVDVALGTNDTELLETAKRLFDNIADCRMYITGGIGSTMSGEQFTCDYALPNDTAYAESCAAIGLAFFAKRLLDCTGERKYAEVLERVLYNNGLSGVSLSGDEFFYANFLEVNSTTFEHGHIRKTRQKWFDCSCCPTSYCRFLPQLGDFCCSVAPGKVRVDIPAAARIISGDCEIEVTGGYPYDGNVRFAIRRGGDFELALRIPEWCTQYTVTLNGTEINHAVSGGYWKMRRQWSAGDRVVLHLDMVPGVVYPHPEVSADAGRAAVQFGPLVYCLESVDNPGVLLHNVKLPRNPRFVPERAGGLPDGTIALRCRAKEVYAVSEKLYRRTAPEEREVEICAIPYALWQNRGASSMQVFLLVE